MDQVEVAGLRVAYRRAGQGSPLVLLHGGMADSREWRRQFEGLADEFTVVAWDAPGCGGSEDPPAAWRLPDYADCLAGLIQALELGRPLASLRPTCGRCCRASRCRRCCCTARPTAARPQR